MTDLDDFFAKKDRKKSKSTKKFSTTDEVAKKLEDTSKKVDKLKKERLVEGEENCTPSNEQDEWKDFEEEKKDYTGLKIGNLTISQNADANTGGGNVENNSEIQPVYNDSGNEVVEKVGPWKKVNVEMMNSSEKENNEKKEVEVIKPEVVQTTQKGVYVTPALRHQPVQQAIQPSRLRSKAAPDIHNEEYFPTLSGGKGTDKKNRNEGAFEVVSHSKSSSYRHAEQSKLAAGQGPKLTLGNRYNTLSNDS